MQKQIDRIRPDRIWSRALDERIRSYRFPRAVCTYGKSFYVPNTEFGICDPWITRTHKRNRAWYLKVNRATKHLADLDIKRISVRYQSRIMRIELLSGPHIIDYGNRWERIEGVFSEVFSLPIEDAH